MKFSALIPLRGGSKSIPRKNIKSMNGKPLCMWVIDEALSSKLIKDVFVSTDSNEIKKVISRYTDNVIFIDRPPSLASDDASTEDVIQHSLKFIHSEFIVTIQATSPLLTSHDLDAGIQLILENEFDSLLSAVRSQRFFWTDEGIPINYQPEKRPRRQDFKGTLVENGALYITKRSLLLRGAPRLTGKIGIYEMSAESYHEVDEPSDWEVVEAELKKRHHRPTDLNQINTLFVDCDGTLTDGGMYYGENGEALKRFCTQDAVGLALLSKQGIRVVIVTGEDSQIVAARMKKLGIEDVHLGIKNKPEIITRHMQQYGLEKNQIAYIGDDLNDLPCREYVAYFACPAKACQQIKHVSDYICKNTGGFGAVREVAERILAEHSHSKRTKNK